MKHAYLIIAHNEFEVLQQLLYTLDDVRNDIYIHFDKKLTDIPVLICIYAQLHIIQDRVDVRWGHVSQIKTEYALFAEAYRRSPEYAYFHVMSGVHLPLFNQDYIHDFFHPKKGKQLIPKMETSSFQSNLKMNRYNLFMPYFAHTNKFISRIAQIGWRLAQNIQQRLHIRRYSRSDYQYGSNWVSLTPDAVAYLLSIRRQVLKRYKYTFCGDEFFVPTELSTSGLDFRIEYNDYLLKHAVGNANAKVYRIADYEELAQSGCLFARKFSGADMELINKIIELNSMKG